jgi:hypothetical protein
MKKLICICLCHLILSVISVHAHRKPKKLDQLTDQKLYNLFEKIYKNKYFKISLYNSNIGRFIYYSNDNDSGYFFVTGDYASEIGYRGPTSVGLNISCNGKILKQCILIQSTDTKSYVSHFFGKNKQTNKNKFFQQFNNKNILFDTNDNEKTPFIKIDTVTGATRTSNGIEKSINKTLKIISIFFKTNKIKNNLIFNNRLKLKKINLK